jgi:hypothetical protein
MYPSGVGYPWFFARDGEEIDVEVTGLLALHDHELRLRRRWPALLLRTSGKIARIHRSRPAGCSGAWKTG